jgi:hypothetical protein
MSQRVILPNNRIITYQIDARGRRIGKKVDNAFEYGFIYIINNSLQRENDASHKECVVPMGDQLNPIAKVDESGNIVEQYVYGLKNNVPEYLIKDNKKYKIISNHLGSPIEIAEANMGALPVLQIKYDSFGNILE